MTKHNCTNPPHFPPHCGCPAGVVEAQLKGMIVAFDGEPKRWPVSVDLRFEEDRPYEVEATFRQPLTKQEDATWIFSREVMMAALVAHGTVGLHDVQFRYDSPLDGGSGTLDVIVSPPEGQAVVRLPYNRIALFLAETAKLVLHGKENITPAIDTFLKEVFA